MSEILWCADNGDGTYRNPVLYCDYSDPDAICVNGTYYLTFGRRICLHFS